MISSMLLLPLFEGTHASDREIMTPLQSHLRVNADACLQDAARHSYYCSQPIRVWVRERGVERRNGAPVRWINGVNNSLWRFSDYAPTESPHSTGRQTKTAQSGTSTQKTQQTSSRTLVIPACFHKPYKWCHMHTETTCTEVGHLWIYRPKRERD